MQHQGAIPGHGAVPPVEQPTGPAEGSISNGITPTLHDATAEQLRQQLELRQAHHHGAGGAGHPHAPGSMPPLPFEVPPAAQALIAQEVGGSH